MLIRPYELVSERSDSIFSVAHVSVAYQAGQRVLDDATFAFPAGSINGLIGPNGAGKSTLLRAILNMIPHQGQGYLDDIPLAAVAKDIAYVAQTSRIDLTFPITVLGCVLLGTYPRLALLQRPRERERRAARSALAEVDMLDFQQRQIGQLSGGQLQRVFLARCLVQHARLIILDEPFAGIDAHSEQVMMALLRTLAHNGETILMVHHDLKTVPAYFDNVALINRRVIAAGPTATAFTDDALRQAYGLADVGGDRQ